MLFTFVAVGIRATTAYGSGGMSIDYAKVLISNWLTTEYLVDWILSNRIIHNFFIGENAHTSLMVRSPDLLKFVAGENMLNNKLLDVIWGAADTTDTEQEVIMSDACELSLYTSFNNYCDILVSDKCGF